MLVILAGCAKTELPEVPAVNPAPASPVQPAAGSDPIDFGLAWTKAFIESDAQLQADGTGISIFGKATDGTITITPFNNNKLTYSPTPVPGKWTYTGGTETWIDSFTYSFYAVYPYNASNAFSQNGNSVVFSAEAIYPTKQTDYLVFAESGNHSYYNSKGGKVTLEMAHSCARLQFQIINDSGRDIEITDARLSGFYTTGDCTLSISAQNKPSISWATTGTKDGNFVAELEFPYQISKSSTSAIDLYKADIIAIPQNASPVYSISYKIGSETFTKSVTLNGQWEAGKKYLYKMTLDEISIIVEDKFWTPIGLDVTSGKGVVKGQNFNDLECYVYFPNGATQSKQVTVTYGSQTVTLTLDSNNKKTENGKDHYRYYYSPSGGIASPTSNITSGEKQTFTFKASATGYQEQSEGKDIEYWGMEAKSQDAVSSVSGISAYAEGNKKLYVFYNKTLNDYLYNDNGTLYGKTSSPNYTSLFALSPNNSGEFSIESILSQTYVHRNGTNASLTDSATDFKFYDDGKNLGIVDAGIELGKIYATYYGFNQSNATSKLGLVKYRVFLGSKISNIQEFAVILVTFYIPN